MRVALLSDLHLEFHRDGGRGFINALELHDVDVLVLAGDIDTLECGLTASLRAFCDLVPQVVFVAGNHEYYGASKAAVDDALASVVATTANFHWLNGTEVTIDSQRFLGGTLWFPERADNAVFESRLSDFDVIDGFKAFVYTEHARVRAFLQDNVTTNDVVVTHHLPISACVNPRYQRSSLNRFFVADVDDIVHSNAPKLWLFGHTHSSFDRTIGTTRFLCNPFGYVGQDLNPQFTRKKIIELGGPHATR